MAQNTFPNTGSVGLGTTTPDTGSKLEIKSSWGNWMSLRDSYSDDLYGFHNPNNGGRLELYINDGVTGENKFGVFTVRKSGNIGMGTNTPIGKLHVKGETYIEDGWLRVKGNRGIFFQDYGGGFYM